VWIGDGGGGVWSIGASGWLYGGDGLAVTEADWLGSEVVALFDQWTGWGLAGVLTLLRLGPNGVMQAQAVPGVIDWALVRTPPGGDAALVSLRLAAGGRVVEMRASPRFEVRWAFDAIDGARLFVPRAGDTQDGLDVSGDGRPDVLVAAPPGEAGGAWQIEVRDAGAGGLLDRLEGPAGDGVRLEFFRPGPGCPARWVEVGWADHGSSTAGEMRVR
jgi:hypothetical protein